MKNIPGRRVGNSRVMVAKTSAKRQEKQGIPFREGDKEKKKARGMI